MVVVVRGRVRGKGKGRGKRRGRGITHNTQHMYSYNIHIPPPHTNSPAVCQSLLTYYQLTGSMSVTAH